MTTHLAALARSSMVLGSFGALLVVACAPPELEDYRRATPVGIADEPAPSAGVGAPHAGRDCASAVEGRDPSQFGTCVGTQAAPGRCVPGGLMGPFADTFEIAACAAGTSCVPDALVATGTNVTLKKCKPVLGKTEDEGRCFSTLAKDVVANFTMLKNATGEQCAAHEVCVPCVNVLKGNAPTGVCFEPTSAKDCKDNATSSSGSSSGTPSGTSSSGGTTVPLACPYVGPPVIDVSVFPVAECGAGMRCVPGELLASVDVQKSLKACDNGGYCAPEKSVAAAGNYVPKTCVAIAGAEGRCTNENVPGVAAQKAQLSKDTCDNGELCAPCFNPLDGQDSGACRTAKCDAPVQAPVLFKSCCQRGKVSKGKCVPTPLVAANLQSNLGTDNGKCTAGKELCVASEAIAAGASYKGAACKGKGAFGAIFGKDYAGVCLSDCLDFSFTESLGVAKGNCKADELCVPCKNPLTQQPTGAPGCAP